MHEVPEEKIDFASIKKFLLPSNLINLSQYFQKAAVVFQKNTDKSGFYLFLFNKAEEEFDSFWKKISVRGDPQDVYGSALY